MSTTNLEYKTIDTSKPIVTRNGKKVSQIFKFDGLPGNEESIFGVIEGNDYVSKWYSNGRYYMRDSNDADLFNTPEIKVIPLTAADIKPTDLFRAIGNNTICFMTIAFVDEYAIKLNGYSSDMSYKSLRAKYLISRDGGMTWQNCEKEIEA